MPPGASARKRRAQSDVHDDQASPPQRRKTQHSKNRQRRGGESSTQGARRSRRAREEEEEEEEEANGDVDIGDDDDDDDAESHGEMNKERLVKGLVRLALASEYSRQPIRRSDISSKVLGTQGRQFKEVFDQAQSELRRVFGMELTELPMREKTKHSQRRAAQTADKAPSTSKSYILTTVLPPSFREPEILTPHGFKESTYTGLITFIISVIYLNGRSLPAVKLNSYLRRLNAEDWTPIDRTEKLLATMQRQGYLVRIKDNISEETSYEYQLGPRAKIEIGTDGVMNMVKTVYGISAPEDLEARVMRNIGVEVKGDEKGEDEAVANSSGGGGGGRGTKKTAKGKGRSARRQREEEEEEEADDDD